MPIGLLENLIRIQKVLRVEDVLDVSHQLDLFLSQLHAQVILLCVADPVFSRDLSAILPGSGVQQFERSVQFVFPRFFRHTVTTDVDVQIAVSRMAKGRNADPYLFRDIVGILDEIGDPAFRDDNITLVHLIRRCADRFQKGTPGRPDGFLPFFGIHKITVNGAHGKAQIGYLGVLLFDLREVVSVKSQYAEVSQHQLAVISVTEEVVAGLDILVDDVVVMTVSQRCCSLEGNTAELIEVTVYVIFVERATL